MMGSKRIWQKICESMEFNKSYSEEKLQMLIENIFDWQLGWDKNMGCISRQSIHFGSANYGIPDLVLCKNNKKLICIELKKYLAGINDRNKEQLFSYMRQLKLSFGILWGNTIQVYYDEISDVNPPIFVCEIKFDLNNDLGVKLIEQLNFETFNADDFKCFCADLIKLKQNQKDYENKIQYLCSAEGVEHIKNLLKEEYPSDIVDKLDIVVAEHKSANKRLASDGVMVEDEYVEDVNGDRELARKKNEKIQDWIKRVLLNFEENHLLTEQELQNLHNLEYCKNNFGIQFPLLVDNEIDTCFAGHSRYWTSWPSRHQKYMNKFYVCSEWWKAHETKYEFFINQWINKVINSK